MRFFLTIPIFFISLFSLFSQNDSDKSPYKIMFYNVENLFDTVDDPAINDDEFTPSGDRHWTTKKLDQKIENIAKVFVAAAEWNSPALVGLCEIENQFVLEKLVNHPLLRNQEYRIIHKDSPDHRGIDVAILYKKDLFTPKDYSTIPIVSEGKDTVATREILHVEGKFTNGKKCHFFINHWPSRYGGLMETDSNRKLAALCLKQAIDKILIENPESNIICMGDFNDQLEDESISAILGASSKLDDESMLINISSDWNSEAQTGTIKHQQEWAVFDQFIVTRNLGSSTKARIFNKTFLLEPDTKYTGFKPYRTFAGFRYTGGFSDHLPILLELQK